MCSSDLDSVHLFTPTGGFGMNTGIEDVANLSWKLAAMLQGWGGPKLGASFEAERKPIAPGRFARNRFARASSRTIRPRFAKSWPVARSAGGRVFVTVHTFLR